MLDYDTTKARLVAQARRSARSAGDIASIGGSIALALVGALGVLMNRRLKQAADAT